MKKIIALSLAIACIVGLITACSETNNIKTLAFSHDINGNYRGFSNLPNNYTIEDAEKDGCLVIQDLEKTANNEVWDNFVETATQGNNIGIRIARFYTKDTNSPYFSDLFFNDGYYYYYLFDSSSDIQEKQPFLYLLKLKGHLSKSVKEIEIIILTNDNTLTFDVITKSWYSSNADYIQSVSPYKLVMLDL